MRIFDLGPNPLPGEVKKKWSFFAIFFILLEMDLKKFEIYDFVYFHRIASLYPKEDVYQFLLQS